MKRNQQRTQLLNDFMEEDGTEKKSTKNSDFEWFYVGGGVICANIVSVLIIKACKTALT